MEQTGNAIYMKMKIKVPKDSIWPEQYFDQIVEVDVEAIRFPDSTLWNTMGERYNVEIITKKTGIDQNSTSLADLLGGKPTKLTVEF